jgi:hypothetical protein
MGVAADAASRNEVSTQAAVAWVMPYSRCNSGSVGTDTDWTSAYALTPIAMMAKVSHPPRPPTPEAELG